MQVCAISCVYFCVFRTGAAHPRVSLSGNSCGTTRAGVGWGGRPCGLSADGGIVVAFVSSFLPLGFQIDVLFLGLFCSGLKVPH